MDRARESWPYQRAARAAGGDKFAVPRSLSHELLFPNRRAMARAIKSARTAGFTITRHGVTSKRVWFSRDSRLSDDHLLKNVAEVHDLIAPIRGHYERWIAPLIPEFIDRPIGNVVPPEHVTPQFVAATPLNELATEDLATMWLVDHLAGGDHDFADALFDLPRSYPRATIDMILDVLARLDVAHHRSTTFMLASGPLEDVLREHGPLIIDQVVAEAHTNPPFAFALGGVWSSTFDADVKDRLWGLSDQF